MKRLVAVAMVVGLLAGGVLSSAIASADGKAGDCPPVFFEFPVAINDPPEISDIDRNGDGYVCGGVFVDGDRVSPEILIDNVLPQADPAG